MSDQANLPHADVVAEIRASAASLEQRPDFPGADVARARDAAARLSALDVGDDVRHAALVVEHHAAIDADVPTTATVAPVGWLKRAVKRLTLWYLRYLAQQVTTFGRAVAHLGTAVADRIERIEADHERDVADLRARVERLERAMPSGDPAGDDD